MEYIGKNEQLIEIDDQTGKWSELTLLPEWEEKYYNVYTIRKHGKWVMLKALKKEYADDPTYQAMLEQEFETRYNLAHRWKGFISAMRLISRSLRLTNRLAILMNLLPESSTVTCSPCVAIVRIVCFATASTSSSLRSG